MVLLNSHSGEAEDHLRRSALAVRAIGLAHEVVVPSGYLCEVIARFGIRSRAIFSFIEVERIPYRHRARLMPQFLTDRNLEPMYNVACTLRAFGRVQAEIPEATLSVTGFGSQRTALEALAAELGLRHVSFLGRIPAGEMGAHYDRAKLFLNASNIDNMPLSLLDAFAAGVPVVTTDAGGIPYMVECARTGLVVPMEDDAASVEGALRLLRDPVLAVGIADAARPDCIAHYVWPVVRDQWLGPYRGMAQGDPRTERHSPLGRSPAAATGR